MCRNCNYLQRRCRPLFITSITPEDPNAFSKEGDSDDREPPSAPDHLQTKDDTPVIQCIDNTQTSSSTETNKWDISYGALADPHEMCEQMLGNILPQNQHPIPACELWNKSKHIKKGSVCTVAWAFDNNKINVSLGKVTGVYKRRGNGRLNIQYTGIVGHKPEEDFFGTLPPVETVSIYKIVWHLPDTTVTEERIERTEQTKRILPAASTVENWAPDDLDHSPIPTSRIISPEMIPGVVATYRELMSEYAHSSYSQRHEIWHSVLSAM